jgi:predicted GH43/DUF377 family glycosyl hydrolase
MSLIVLGVSLHTVAAESPGLDIRPVPATAKFADPAYQIWCGSMVEGEDGKFHLFYSRWPAALGHRAWVSHSEVAHAVSDKPGGPYSHVGIALPARGDDFWDGDCTHNPTVHRFDGKYYLYYMGTHAAAETKPGIMSMPHRNNQRIGVAVADSPNGPWQRFDTPLIDVGNEDAHDAVMVSNPSVTRRPDGGYLMVYKAVAKKLPAPRYGPVVHLTATSDSPTGPFTKQNTPVFTAEGSEFPAEDPFIWHQGDRYFAIVKDMKGDFTKAGQSLALFEGKDGFDWTLSKKTLVSRLVIPWEGKEPQQVSALERPQLWLRDGKPEILFCAAAIDKNRTETFNVAIPLLIRR